MATLNIKEYLDRDEQKDLLRFLTAGSVDDGKSTLIGRLLLSKWLTSSVRAIRKAALSRFYVTS